MAAKGAKNTKIEENFYFVSFAPFWGAPTDLKIKCDLSMKKTLLLLSLAALPAFAPAQDAVPLQNTAPTPDAPLSQNPTPVSPPAMAPPKSDAETTRAATLAYNSGLAALKKGDWNEAANKFGMAASLSPNDAGALSFLGYVRLQQKRYDEALTALLAARDVGAALDAKAAAQLQNNIGFAYWNKGSFPEAKAAFNKALELDKTYFDARYNLAFALLSREQWPEALPHLRQLALQNPGDGAIQDGIGEAFEHTDNLSGALGAYRKAVDLEPRNESYRFKLALALVQSDRRAEAATVLRDLLATNPNNAPALLQMGDLNLKSNRWKEAQGVLKRYVTLRGNDFVGRFNLGVAYDYSAMFDEALEQYAKAEALKPDDAATKNNVGRIYYKRGKLPEAITKFNEALKIDGDFVDARTNLAIVLAAQNDYDASNAEWKTLIKGVETSLRATSNLTAKKSLNGRLATARSGIAGNYLASNRYADAAQEYRRLLLLSPNDLEAMSGLGRSLYQTTDYRGAEKAYREILKHDPNNVNALNDLGVTLEAIKDRKGALESYSAAVRLDPNHTEAKSNLQRLTGAAPTA